MALQQGGHVVPVRYTGIPNPGEAFGRLKPFRDEIIRMQGKLRPFATDYLILDALKKALDTAAYHFTREPDFYSMRPEPSRWRRPGD
ncbi:MAG TPA: hypothetical protein VG166_10670 [Caulobacteraceae bacterium]|jgi:hypothetical protein|nr:hypothetical protein [Caulobacteraceae bacterium]